MLYIWLLFKEVCFALENHINECFKYGTQKITAVMNLPALYCILSPAAIRLTKCNGQIIATPTNHIKINLLRCTLYFFKSHGTCNYKSR